MKITRAGVSFSYHGDELVWIWPWRRTDKNDKYYSFIFEHEYPSLAEYWQHVGSWNEACRKNKIRGYTDHNIFLAWIEREFRHSIVVVLHNVNVEMKNTRFWKSMDPVSRRELLKDTSVLFFYDEKEAEKVARSIVPEFAEAYMFVNGRLKYNNNETISGQTEESDKTPYSGLN